MSEFGELFHGIGLLEGTCSIQLKDNAVPVICPPRKVPIALQERLGKELQFMQDKGIITKVTEPT